MYNPLTPQIARIHRENLLKEAGEYRPPADSPRMARRPWERFFFRLGDLLIAAGTKLHLRYSPVLEANGNG